MKSKRFTIEATMDNNGVKEIQLKGLSSEVDYGKIILDESTDEYVYEAPSYQVVLSDTELTDILRMLNIINGECMRDNYKEVEDNEKEIL